MNSIQSASTAEQYHRGSWWGVTLNYNFTLKYIPSHKEYPCGSSQSCADSCDVTQIGIGYKWKNHCLKMNKNKKQNSTGLQL